MKKSNVCCKVEIFFSNGKEKKTYFFEKVYIHTIKKEKEI